MESDEIIREQLKYLLKDHNAHIAIEKCLKDFPHEHINAYLENVDYNPWQLLEHMRIAQWDIIEFINNPNHVSPKWPDGYWPSKEIAADNKMWDTTVVSFLSDLDLAEELVSNPETNLYIPLTHAPEYTIFREILLIADHNAYHLGQLVLFNKCVK